MAQRILVIGATGMLGKPVARQLLLDGYNVRLLVRNPDRARTIFGDSCEIIPGDVEQPDTVARALRGCDGVHINLNGGPQPESYQRIDCRGTATVARLAAQLGVGRLTYISIASIRQERTWFYLARAKYQAEAAIRESGLAYTIFRPTWFMESLPLFVRGKMALNVGNQRTPLHWVAAEDYARMVSCAYRTPAAQNRTLYVYGPEAIPMPNALRSYCSAASPGAWLVKTPLWLLALLGRLSMKPDLQDGARVMAYYRDVTDDCDPSEANRILGAPTTTLRQWCESQRRLAAGNG